MGIFQRFLLKKNAEKILHPGKSLFANIMGNLKFICSHFNRNTQRKQFRIETLREKNVELKYGPSHFKSDWGINFLLLEVVKLKRSAFPMSEIDSKNRFEMRSPIYIF